MKKFKMFGKPLKQSGFKTFDKSPTKIKIIIENCSNLRVNFSKVSIASKDFANKGAIIKALEEDDL